jgi:opine dehydrogenase
MRISGMLTPGGVIVGMDDVGKDAAIRQLVSTLAGAKGMEVEAATKDILARERAGPALIPLGKRFLAIPHACTNACKQLVVAVGISKTGVRWEPAADARANIIFVFLGPPQTQPLYLRALSRVARLCESADLVEAMIEAPTAQHLIELVAQAEQSMEDIVGGEGLPTFCVLGAGHGGLAMAAHLALTGCRVNLFNRTPEHIGFIRDRGGIEVDGEIKGFAALNLVTSEPAEAVDNVDILMVVVPATAHRAVVESIAPHIKDGQILVLNPGRTGGALEVAQLLRTKRGAKPYIAEAQTLLYASRAIDIGKVRIFGIKNSVPLAALPAYQIADILPVIRRALPQFVPADNVLKTSLDNIGAVFHPAITVLNAGRIEDTHGDFRYYVEGVTPAVAAVLEAVDRERVEVASALGIRAHTAREWLYLAYDAPGKTLLDAMRANIAYAEITAPGTIHHRYISEDVPSSLVPIASIGEMLNVPTPNIRTIIQIASTMHGVDYWKEGRTVERLGIKGMSVKDIRFLVVGAESAQEQNEHVGRDTVDLSFSETAEALNLW